MTTWIKCSDRLPEAQNGCRFITAEVMLNKKNQIVCECITGASMIGGKLISDNVHMYRDQDAYLKHWIITHWAELPEPPKD